MGCGQSDAKKPTSVINIGYWNAHGSAQSRTDLSSKLYSSLLRRVPGSQMGEHSL